MVRAITAYGNRNYTPEQVYAWFRRQKKKEAKVAAGNGVNISPPPEKAARKEIKEHLLTWEQDELSEK